MTECVSFTVRTADFINNGILANVANNQLSDFDNNYIAVRNEQNVFQIYSLDLRKILGSLYDKYEYFNIILRHVITGGDAVIDDFVPMFWCVSGFDWTNHQNVFKNEKMMGIGFINDLASRFASHSSQVQLQKITPSILGFKTFRKQPIIDFNLFVRNSNSAPNEQSNELLLETSKVYFTFRFEIYPCINI